MICPHCAEDSIDPRKCRYIEMVAMTMEPADQEPSHNELIFDAATFKYYPEATKDEGLECPICWGTIPIPADYDVEFV